MVLQHRCSNLVMLKMSSKRCRDLTWPIAPLRTRSWSKKATL